MKNLFQFGWLPTFVLIAQSAISSSAAAHAVGTSYVTIEASADSSALKTRVDLTLRDLEFAVGLDLNGDGQITWGEVLASDGDLVAYIGRNLAVAQGGLACSLTKPDIAIDRHADEMYAALTFESTCTVSGAIVVKSNLMFDLDDSHRTLLTVKNRTDSSVTVLTANSRDWKQEGARIAAWESVVRFVAQGIWHIWIGFDHLAFLMLLLLPLTRAPARNEGNPHSDAARKILKVVTAFTAAHSITLACAALGYVNLPSRWTEAAIAASIVIAAAANLLSKTDRFGLGMAFGFGLIHGLGFASALADITTNTSNRVLPLIGFNLGVEIGQLAVVLAVFPFLFLRNSSPRFKQRTALIGSAIMGALGVAWLVQRTIL